MLSFISSANMKFDLTNPISISRPILLSPELRMTGAFYLPGFSQTSFETSDFVGDIERGGSCNVRIQSFTPHNLTHVETSLHIVKNGHPISDFPRELFQGLIYLVDLTELPQSQNKTIGIDDIRDKLSNVSEKCKFFAIKTVYSNKEIHFNFTNTSPIALNPDLTQFLAEYYPHITGIFLDLPSADIEEDGGKLLAHRNFFEIPSKGIIADPHPMKFISELGYFHKLQEGYYFCILTPPKIETDAIISDILFYPKRE